MTTSCSARPLTVVESGLKRETPRATTLLSPSITKALAAEVLTSSPRNRAIAKSGLQDLLPRSSTDVSGASCLLPQLGLLVSLLMHVQLSMCTKDNAD